MFNWIKRMRKGNTEFKDYELEQLFQSCDVKNAKPCPFCGKEQLNSYNRSILTLFEMKKWYFVTCQRCGARTSEFSEKESAISAWNRRV